MPRQALQVISCAAVWRSYSEQTIDPALQPDRLEAWCQSGEERDACGPLQVQAAGVGEGRPKGGPRRITGQGPPPSQWTPHASKVCWCRLRLTPRRKARMRNRARGWLVETSRPRPSPSRRPISL